VVRAGCGSKSKKTLAMKRVKSDKSISTLRTIDRNASGPRMVAVLSTKLKSSGVKHAKKHKKSKALQYRSGYLVPEFEPLQPYCAAVGEQPGHRPVIPESSSWKRSSISSFSTRHSECTSVNSDFELETDDSQMETIEQASSVDDLDCFSSAQWLRELNNNSISGNLGYGSFGAGYWGSNFDIDVIQGREPRDSLVGSADSNDDGESDYSTPEVAELLGNDFLETNFGLDIY